MQTARHAWDLIRELTTIMSDLDMLAVSWTKSKSKSVSAEAELKTFDEVTDFHHYQYTIQGAGHQWNRNVVRLSQPGHQ